MFAVVSRFIVTLQDLIGYYKITNSYGWVKGGIVGTRTPSTWSIVYDRFVMVIHFFLLDEALDQVVDNGNVGKELSNNHLDIQSELSIHINTNWDLDNVKNLDLGIHLCKDFNVNCNDNLGDEIMDQADDLRNKFVDIDRVSGGDSLVDETVDGGIETGVDVSDGSMDDGTDSNCMRERWGRRRKCSNRSVHAVSFAYMSIELSKINWTGGSKEQFLT